MRHFLFALLILSSTLSIAQTAKNYYVPENIDSLEHYFNTIHKNYLKKIDGKYASEIKKKFENQVENRIRSIKDSNYYFNGRISKNLEGVLNNIFKANPNIDTSNFSFFIKNSITANAACYGDGMFEINMGLFNILDSDDELASILCHELAHYVSQDGIRNVTNYVKKINSKDTKAKLKAIKKKRYGRGRAALSFIDELSVNMLDYSKEVEAEADSLGYILLSKTNYSTSKALSALKKLQRIDDMVFHYAIKIDSIFNFEEYPFQSYWLKESTSLFATDTKIDDFGMVSDTLKTHPEIDFRVEKLKTDFKIPASKKATTLSLQKIKTITYKQSINNLVDLNRLDMAVYELIKCFEQGMVSKMFYHETMMDILKKVYKAKKNHSLAKYVPQKSSFSEEKELNKIRLFLHNLELNEVKKIGKAFCNKTLTPSNPKCKFFNN